MLNFVLNGRGDDTLSQEAKGFGTLSTGCPCQQNINSLTEFDVFNEYYVTNNTEIFI